MRAEKLLMTDAHQIVDLNQIYPGMLLLAKLTRCSTTVARSDPVIQQTVLLRGSLASHDTLKRVALYSITLADMALLDALVDAAVNCFGSSQV